MRVLGVRARSNSSVTVTVNGQSRTFKDGEGVTFTRNQGAKQTVSGDAAFAGYGVTFAPLEYDDYAQRTVSGKSPSSSDGLARRASLRLTTAF